MTAKIDQAWYDNRFGQDTKFMVIKYHNDHMQGTLILEKSYYVRVISKPKYKKAFKDIHLDCLLEISRDEIKNWL